MQHGDHGNCFLVMHVGYACLGISTLHELYSRSTQAPFPAISPEKANLYEVVHYVVKPSTLGGRCSYIELVAFAAQIPTWFASHWWGEAVPGS